jgi:serine/threonine protein kinase/Tfp pilus assembly protein PilF
MTPEHWEQIKRQFHAALEYEPAERAAFLARECAGDGPLRHELESLLASHERAKNFIETPASDVAAALLSEDKHGLVAGQTVGPYKIAGVLATGGMGEVYLADDARLGRKIALKLLPTQFIVNADRVRRFGQEARAASALNHPNIVTIHDIGQTDSVHFIATEFVEGETLREHMANTWMTMGEVLDVATQVASALQAAHAAGIVHRDVKPENIILRRDGIVKVLDFGLAKLAPHQTVLAQQASTKSEVKTNPGVIMGTVGYMSPEQAKGELVDERTDIFSLGVVIHEMIAGKTPFAGDSMSETFANLINAEPQPLSSFALNVPDELQRIVSKMLRKNIDERYQTMKGLLAELKDLRENPPFDEKLERSYSPDDHATAVLPATTGDANKQTTETQNDLSQRIKRNKSLAALTLVPLLISAIGLGYYLFYAGKTASSVEGKKSIAVLPLKPINTENRDQLYEIGVADSLILKLSSLKGFIVRPLSATRKYADVEQDPLAAGKEQQVDYVLASNYQLAGGKIRVTSQLLNVANGQIEETYKSERDAANVFAMQDAIAVEVGNILSARFVTTARSPTAKRGTTNEEAYRLFLQGMYLVDKRNPADARKAVGTFDQAVRLDPNYAQAWAGKAHAHRGLSNLARSDTHEEYQKSMQAIGKALALDENLADAHSALCENKMYYEYDFNGAERECKRAIELDSNSSLAHQIYSRFLFGRGRFDESIAEAKTAIDLEPTSLFNQRIYGNSLSFARRYDEAAAQFKRVIAMDPNFSSAYRWLSESLEMQGNYDEAFEWFMKSEEGKKDDKSFQHFDDKTVHLFKTAYQTSGWQGVLREQARQFEETEAPYTYRSGVNAQSGNKDKASEYLEKAYQRRELWLSMLKVDPRLDSLRDDPRFDELVKRVESK